MALIGKEIAAFNAKAFHKGEFIDVSSENFKGQWSVVCFYPADFTFVCPTELGDLQNEYATLKSLAQLNAKSAANATAKIKKNFFISLIK